MFRMNTMALSAFTIVSVLISTTASAATTGSITISGNVPASTSITVTPVAGYNALDLTAGGTDVQVANVQEKNNTAAGYTVQLVSANAGTMKYTSGPTTLGSVSYTAKYNGTAVTLSTAAQTVTSVSSQTSPAKITKALSVSFPGDPNGDLLSGTYSDTLTLDIIAN